MRSSSEFRIFNTAAGHFGTVWNRLGRDHRKMPIWVPICLFYDTRPRIRGLLAIMGDFSEGEPVGIALRPITRWPCGGAYLRPKAREKTENWRLILKTAKRTRSHRNTGAEQKGHFHAGWIPPFPKPYYPDTPCKFRGMNWTACYETLTYAHESPGKEKQNTHPIMNLKEWLCGFGLVLVLTGHTLNAQQSEADRNLLADIRAKAENGDAQSQYELGLALYVGRLGVAKDEAEGAMWFRKAAEQNIAWAQGNLGVCYLYGNGVVKDEAEAVKWYRKAAAQNDTKAQVKLGICYKRGTGTAKDEVEAVRWYRKAAEQNYSEAQYFLGVCYLYGEGVAQDEVEAVRWFRKAAEQNLDSAEFYLGVCYAKGKGVAQDEVEAVKWYRKAAEQNYSAAQHLLGNCFFNGNGVVKDEAEAVKWYRKAAEQNDELAQSILGMCHKLGIGVAKDYVEAYKWFLLAAAKGHEESKKNMTIVEGIMTREQIAEGQKLARNFKPREVPSAGADSSGMAIAQTRPESSGTGFFVTEDGYLITNEHVVREGTQVRLVTEAGIISGKVLKVDAANDLALLKAAGKFVALPVVSSRGVRLGATVATLGFPNIGLQGFAPKLAKGEIAGLAGAQDDARHFQISTPIQPGNSGGALVDERGNVVGVVVAKLSQGAALASTGTLAENVNYAVKSSYLLSFLESVPAVAAKLKEPNMKERKFEDVVKDAQQATVLILVY
jgi:TPR repeat protein